MIVSKSNHYFFAHHHLSDKINVTISSNHFLPILGNSMLQNITIAIPCDKVEWERERKNTAKKVARLCFHSNMSYISIGVHRMEKNLILKLRTESEIWCGPGHNNNNIVFTNERFAYELTLFDWCTSNVQFHFLLFHTFYLYVRIL